MPEMLRLDNPVIPGNDQHGQNKIDQHPRPEILVNIMPGPLQILLPEFLFQLFRKHLTRAASLPGNQCLYFFLVVLQLDKLIFVFH